MSPAKSSVAYAGGSAHALSPWPRWSSAATWWRSAGAVATASNQWAWAAPPWSRRMPDGAAGPHSSRWRSRPRMSTRRLRAVSQAKAPLTPPIIEGVGPGLPGTSPRSPGGPAANHQSRGLTPTLALRAANDQSQGLTPTLALTSTLGGMAEAGIVSKSARDAVMALTGRSCRALRWSHYPRAVARLTKGKPDAEAPRRRDDRDARAGPRLERPAPPSALRWAARGDPDGPGPARGPPAVDADAGGGPRRLAEHGARRVRPASRRGLSRGPCRRGDHGRVHLARDAAPGAPTGRAGGAARPARRGCPAAALSSSARARPWPVAPRRRVRSGRGCPGSSSSPSISGVASSPAAGDACRASSSTTAIRPATRRSARRSPRISARRGPYAARPIR